MESTRRAPLPSPPASLTAWPQQDADSRHSEYDGLTPNNHGPNHVAN